VRLSCPAGSAVSPPGSSCARPWHNPAEETANERADPPRVCVRVRVCKRVCKRVCVCVSTYNKGVVGEGVSDLQVLEEVGAPVVRVSPRHRGTDGTHLEKREREGERDGDAF